MKKQKYLEKVEIIRKENIGKKGMAFSTNCTCFLNKNFRFFDLSCRNRLTSAHERFAQEEEFDWLGKLSDFEHLLNLEPNSTVLVLGCGNSKLSTELRNKGHFVISTDYSNNVCQKQKMVTGLEYSGLAFSVLPADQL